MPSRPAVKRQTNRPEPPAQSISRRRDGYQAYSMTVKKNKKGRRASRVANIDLAFGCDRSVSCCIDQRGLVWDDTMVWGTITIPPSTGLPYVVKKPWIMLDDQFVDLSLGRWRYWRMQLEDGTLLTHRQLQRRLKT